MGKVKRGRQKLHISGKKADFKNKKCDEESETKTSGAAMIVDIPKATAQQTPQPFLPPIGEGANIFSGVRINKQSLISQKLPDFDARSTVTSKSLKGLGLKKKDKKKLRHELWMDKLNAVQAARQKQKDRKRKEKTVVVGDLTDLQDALPTLELLMKKPKVVTRPEPSNKDSKPKGIQKEQVRRKIMLENMAVFKQVLNHSMYKENPRETITKHLKNKLQQEADMDS